MPPRGPCDLSACKIVLYTSPKLQTASSAISQFNSRVVFLNHSMRLVQPVEGNCDTEEMLVSCMVKH